MASVQDYEMAQHEGADSEGDWETDSGDEIEEEQAAKCLFSDDLLPSVTAALEHDATHFGFDFHRYVKEARLCRDDLQIGMAVQHPAILHVSPFTCLVLPEQMLLCRQDWMITASSNVSTS